MFKNLGKSLTTVLLLTVLAGAYWSDTSPWDPDPPAGGGGAGPYSGDEITGGTFGPVDAQNLTSLAPENLSPGTIPTDIAVQDGSITTLDASKLTGSIANSALDSSSVTLQGNSFNGASQLLLLDGGGLLSGSLVSGGTFGAVNGSALTAISASNLGSGTVPNARLDSTSVTLQGNTFNAASKLVRLDGSGLLSGSLVSGGTFGAVNGSALTALNASSLVSGSVSNSLLDSSSVTLQGNTFNTASKLVQLNGSGLLSGSLVSGGTFGAVNGSALTSLNASSLGSGTVSNSLLDSSSVTLQGNTFNAASKLVQLNGSGLASGSLISGGTFGAVDGSALTTLNASNLASGTVGAARLPAFTGDATSTVGTVALTLASSIPSAHTWTGAGVFTSTAGITIQGAESSSLGAPLTVYSTATAGATQGGGIVYIGRPNTTALSSSQLGQIVFVGGDGSVARGEGASINVRAGGTWNSGSHRSHMAFATAITNSVDAGSFDLGIQDTGQVTIGTTTISAGVPSGTGLLTLGARGDMPALAMTGIAGEPTGLVNGGIYYNTTQKAIRYQVQGTTESFVGALWTKTVASTVTATTTETSLLGTGFGTLNLPANFWVAGKTVKIHLEGLISTDAATPGTHLFNVKLDAVVISSSAANTPGLGLASAHWEMDVTLTCRSTGGSGTVIGSGSFRYDNALVGGFWGIKRTEATIVTVDTTQADLITVNLTNGTNDADNIFVTQNGYIEVLN